MAGDVFGVRIIPPVLQFFNTVPHMLSRLPISVMNVSSTSKNIRYYGPKSENFSLKVKNPEEPVAPGLCVTAMVEYCPMIEKEDRDRIVLTVDGNVIEVPIFAHPCQSVMELTEVANFGTLVANSKPVVKEIILTNTGMKKGDFNITYKGSKHITISPSSGTLPPHSELKIKVEYVASLEGQFQEVAEVYLEGQEVKTLTIKGSVIQRALELLSTNGDNSRVECVRFGSTYYGTDRLECAVLYNNGPEQINFVAVIDENAIAQEMGVDLTKSVSAALADEGEDVRRGHINEVTSLIAVIPNQGILVPHQKTPIYFRFSPRWYSSKQGWKTQICPPPRKDFALFVKLQVVGSSNGYLDSYDAGTFKGKKRLLEGMFVEVALTGTALPVLLNIAPTAKLDFGECPVGEHADILCTVKNESNILPILFEFRRIAHFTAYPSCGKILPGQAQDVIFSFAPKQIGTFKLEQFLDVLGQITDRMNPLISLTHVVYTARLKLSGCSNPVTSMPQAKFNPGITPYITNEVGLFVDTTFKDLKDVNLRNAVAGSTKTKFHQLKSLKRPASLEYGGNAKVAFPNDRACSVRSSKTKEKYKSLFTHSERYHYVDPDYAFDDLETENRLKHRLGYLQLIHKSREKRLEKKQYKEFQKTNNNLDIGIKPAAGIFPKKLTQAEILQETYSELPPNLEWKILSTKELAKSEKQVISKRICDGLHAVPTTTAEKKDCAKWLSPQELHQVVVGPPVIDFDQVCVRSICQKELKIINNLPQFIHIVAEIDCLELRQSSPLSQVVPPQSKAVIPIIFESSTKETFQRSIVYTINGFYKHHIVVLAEVVPVALELSAVKINLKPSPGMPVEAGFRGVVTLLNKQNYQADFTWSPDMGEKGTAFSIRPASGVVDAYSDLECEVVWHASFMAPEEGSFTLFISGGESRKLHCTAEVGNTNMFFLDQRINFGAAPVNLTTVMSSRLHNSGSNHGYFYIIDPNPLPNLIVSPVSGVVPVGGSTEIHLALTPDSIVKFDNKIMVAIKGGKTLELRVAGSVESPNINISVSSFNFGGVYSGSSATIPFNLENKAKSKCRFEVDLTKYQDFSIKFPGCQTQEDFNFQLLHPGKASVTLDPEEVIQGEITFAPKQVAAYDFTLPVTVNYLQDHEKRESQTKTSTISNSTVQHFVNPKPTPPLATVSHKQVIATAMRQPLQLDTNRLEFILPCDFQEKSNNSKAGVTKDFSITNISSETITWGFDLRAAEELLNKGIFKILNADATLAFIENNRRTESQLDPGQKSIVHFNFWPATARQYQIVMPVVINSSWSKPFQFLELVGEMKGPAVWFEPTSIVLTPVPLLTETCAEFTLFALHYKKPTKFTAATPHIECEDESKISPLSVTFPEGDVIKPVKSNAIQVDPCTLLCRVTFSSPKPLSFSQPVVFSDEKGNKFRVQVTAMADNCLLTCYPFIAQHRCDYKIVCEQGSLPKGCRTTRTKQDEESVRSGEAVLVSCVSSSQTNGRSTSTTSSSFEPSSSSYESSTTATDYASLVPGAREGAKNKSPTCSDYGRYKAGSAGSATFQPEDSEEAVFFMEVVMAVQRWFSYQGWPGGPYPIVIPETLRTAISKKTAADVLKNAEEAASKTTQMKVKVKSKGNYNRLVKTIYDMITFLSGRTLPGIPANVSLPSNLVDRVRQIYWQHCTLLTFLRCQGACVATILPEYLMTPGDYILWRQLQQTVKLELLQQGNVEDAEKIQFSEDIAEEVFEAISKKMWTDVMLQILKVLVLAKVTPKTLKALSIPDKDIVMPVINTDPCSSNIYSVPERILLAWMNYHYESNRELIWKKSLKGGVPPTRWIVNFDYDLLDGLVVAALLGSHMPFLIKTHLQGMYTSPATAEQCLHNALKVVCAMRYVGIDYDIHAIDITDPNPISMLLFVVHLYERLPQYLPKATVDFVGSLHSVVARQVKVSNTSAKSLVYNVLLAGQDACDFNVLKGNVITVPSKSTLLLTVEFKSRFLRPADAVLALVGKRQGSAIGNTMIFNLITEIDTIKPKATVKVESPCYELEQIVLEVKNPFSQGGIFQIILIEYRSNSKELSVQTSLAKDKKKNTSKTNILKKKTESQTDVIPMNRILEHKESMTVKNSQIPTLLAFHTTTRFIHLDSQEAKEMRVDFLPFHVGERQCSVVLLNENIGEFLYSIDAKALEPLPSYLPYTPSKNSVRISSTAVAGSGKTKDNNSTIYWRCESGSMLKESLLIPMTNAAKERALVIIAQQQMDSVEKQRRQITGTLMSCSVMAKTMKNLSNNPTAAISLAKAMGPVADVYRVEVDSEFFQVPDMLVMPNFQDTASKCMPNDSRIGKDVNLADGVAELVVQFKAKEPGLYLGTITLTAIDDVRIYRIECTVTPQGISTELEFHTPVYQSVTQDIPIVNMSEVDWPIVTTITGRGFHGPQTLLARAHGITNYPLTFKPMKEEEIVGKLTFANKSDGSEQILELIGKGEKPLPLDQIQLTCGARASLHHTVKVPNVTSKRLTYRVESDLPFITGEQTITVLPHQTGTYTMVITSNRRGQFKGILAFIAGKCRVNEIDSDEEVEIEEEAESEFHGYRMWYSLEIEVKAPLPEKTVTVVCDCFNKTLVDFIVRNPTPKEITLKASIRGSELTGPLSITLEPGVKDVYSLTFAPTQAGESRGSLIFFHEDVGEFWYSLLLKAKPPTPKTLPNMECELGSWTRYLITLNNPTEEAIDMYPSVSNTNNFILEVDTEKPLILKPACTTKVSLKFKPSNLGDGGHTAKVTFSSDQLGEWVFHVSGTGLLPKPHLPVITNAAPGSSSTMFIVFRNPTDMAVLADVCIADNEQDGDSLEKRSSLESPFKLLLKHSSGVRVGPKSSLEIPVSFAPIESASYLAYCRVIIRREDGQQWSYTQTDSLGRKLPSHTTSVSDIRWLYPLHGITDSLPPKEVYQFSSTVHNQLAKSIDVSLSDEYSKGHVTVKTQKKNRSLIPESSIVGHTPETAEEYSFELLYDSDETKNIIDSCVEMEIIKHMKAQSTGIVTLVFDVNFAPTVNMDHCVNLLIKKAQGGFWVFPLRFTATGPPVDDTIVIESSGLDRPSSVGFRLNSQQQHPEDFVAFFENGSDPVFSVTPEKGELAPKDTTGTLITVTFLPKTYGRMYTSKLIVKTASNVQWTYSIKGVLPEYQPPRGVSAHPIAGPHPEVRLYSTKKNYVRRNMKLLATAVSSPLKGAHLVPITKTYNKVFV